MALLELVLNLKTRRITILYGLSGPREVRVEAVFYPQVPAIGEEEWAGSALSGWGLTICIPDKCPRDADAAGQGWGAYLPTFKNSNETNLILLSSCANSSKHW